MKRKEIVVCMLSLTVALTFFLPPVIYSATPNAPFWYGTEDGYMHPQNPLLDPTLPYNPTANPQNTMKCVGSAPSLEANYLGNMFPLFGFNNNPSGTRGLIFNIPEKSWDGYTLLSCMNGCAHPSKPGKMFDALLIDNDGAFIQGWENIKTFPARIWPGGYVTGSGTEGSVIESPALVKQDWCGNEVWRWDSSDYTMPGTQFHHDYQLEGNPVGYYAPPISPSENFLPKVNGSVLALANHVPENTYYYPKGWVPEGHPARDTSNISKFPLVDDAFYLINNKGQITWQWFACDHFEQMGFNDDAKYGIMNTRAMYPDRTDWTHFNNVNWLGPNKLHKTGDNRFNPSNMIFDSRNMNIIAIIANSENPGKWKRGDIIWRVGPDYGPGTPWESLGRIIGPHNAHMIPATLPGGGNILVFDNGGNGGFGKRRADCDGTYPNVLSDYSRVIEFNPITYEVVWEYKNTAEFTDSSGHLNRKFFSMTMSSAQRLVNGNTLIAEANTGRVFEVTKEGEIVWEYYAGAGTTRPGIPGEVGAAVYRAYRVPKTWVPNMTCLQ